MISIYDLKHDYLTITKNFIDADEILFKKNMLKSDALEDTFEYKFYVNLKIYIYSIIAVDGDLGYPQYLAFCDFFDEAIDYDVIIENINTARDSGLFESELVKFEISKSIFILELALNKSFYEKIINLLRDIYVFFNEIEEGIDEEGTLSASNFLNLIEFHYDSVVSRSNEIQDKQSKSNKSENSEIINDKSIDDLIKDLNGLIGLEKVKNNVTSLINHIKVSKLKIERGLKVPEKSMHLVFTGNPGTGKTTIARLISQIYCGLGVLSKGHLIETERSGLIAGYVGQTALKVKEVVESAIGGVLFIDEAYSLFNKDGNDYGTEAINTLLKLMEDHRNDLVIIVAGYPDKMDEFIASNPGLKSRFNNYIFFPDYSPQELNNIFEKMCIDNMLTISEKAKIFNEQAFIRLYESRDSHFGNGRDVRNIFEHAMSNQANRLVEMDMETATNEILNTLDVEDVIYGFESLLQTSNK